MCSELQTCALKALHAIPETYYGLIAIVSCLGEGLFAFLLQHNKPSYNEIRVLSYRLWGVDVYAAPLFVAH